MRAAHYETGRLPARRLDRPVISVGNLTFGGTGKTPLVEAISNALAGEGYDVAVLTRGYGRRGTERAVLRSEAGADASASAGDEPALLARRVPRGTVIVDP